MVGPGVTGLATLRVDRAGKLILEQKVAMPPEARTQNLRKNRKVHRT